MGRGQRTRDFRGVFGVSALVHREGLMMAKSSPWEALRTPRGERPLTLHRKSDELNGGVRGASTVWPRVKLASCHHLGHGRAEGGEMVG